AIEPDHSQGPCQCFLPRRSLWMLASHPNRRCRSVGSGSRAILHRDRSPYRPTSVDGTLTTHPVRPSPVDRQGSPLPSPSFFREERSAALRTPYSLAAFGRALAFRSSRDLPRAPTKPCSPGIDWRSPAGLEAVWARKRFGSV